MGRFVFKLPDVGEGVAEAEIVSWRVAVGDRVEEDQALVDVMTDKATVEIGAPVSGIVAALHGEPGALCPVGSPLIEFETGEAEKPKAKPAPEAKQPEPKAAPVKAEPVAPAPQTLAAPVVRKEAADLGIDLNTVKGSGPEGRVTHQDLAAKTPASGDDGITEVKVMGLRRRIAEKMHEAATRIPHFSYVEAVDVTELEALRAHLNAGRKDGQPKLTLLPLLIAALTRCLPDFPQINARFDDDNGIVRRYRAVHVGIAVQTDAGLTVPVLRHAETRDLWSLAAEITRLADGARAGKLASEDLSGSTITLTSLGPLGGIAHTPVVNWPEVAIVGPNKIVETPVVLDGQIVVRKMMNLSSSFDHRVVDGFDAAAFIHALKGLLEHPGAIFTAQPHDRPAVQRLCDCGRAGELRRGDPAPRAGGRARWAVRGREPVGPVRRQRRHPPSGLRRSQQHLQQRAVDQITGSDRHPQAPGYGSDDMPGRQCPLPGIQLGRRARQLHLRAARPGPHPGHRPPAGG